MNRHVDLCGNEEERHKWEENQGALYVSTFTPEKFQQQVNECHSWHLKSF